MVRTMRTLYNLALIILAAFTSAAFAGSKSVIMPVETTVKPIISIKILQRPEKIDITDADLKKGFVDIDAKTILEVRSNIRSGLLLKFEGKGGPFKKMWILEGEKKTISQDMRGLIRQSYTMEKTTREFHFRFYLSEDARAMSYPWPLKVSAEIAQPENN